jgi:AraC family transcriptional regulator, ethanolamine operon transcriptional activator
LRGAAVDRLRALGCWTCSPRRPFRITPATWWHEDCAVRVTTATLWSRIIERVAAALQQLDVSKRRSRCKSEQITATCIDYAKRRQYQGVTMPVLCAVAGVSERRLREAFHACYRKSPTAYLRSSALREVRASLLSHPHERDAVTRAATDFGFWHLSRFAGHYRELFGESPRETVARARFERSSALIAS